MKASLTRQVRRPVAKAMIVVTIGLLLGIFATTRWNVVWIGRRVEVAIINGSMIVGVPTRWTTEGFLPGSGWEVGPRRKVAWSWWRWQYDRFQSTSRNGRRSELSVAFPLWNLPAATPAFALAGLGSGRRSNEHCRRCGYLLSGLSASSACPECGQIPQSSIAPINQT